MTSIDTLLIRAKRLHGVNDDALEAEWNDMLDLEVESLLADLDARISQMTPEELEAEAYNDAELLIPPEIEAELDAALSINGEVEKKYWFAQQRRKRRRGRR